MQHNEGLSPSRWTIDIGGVFVLASKIIAVTDTGGHEYGATIHIGLAEEKFARRRYAEVIADWHAYLKAAQAEEQKQFPSMYKD